MASLEPIAFSLIRTIVVIMTDLKKKTFFMKLNLEKNRLFCSHSTFQ